MAGKLALVLALALPLAATDVRIGVLGLFRPDRISVRSSEPLQVQAGSRTFLLSAGQVARLRAVGHEIDLSAHEVSSTTDRVVISGRGGAPAVFRLVIDGKIDRSFHGRLEVDALSSRLQPVVLVELEAAVAAVVAAEVPEATPPEAMKAMAVLARSYYVASARRHRAYDFCDTTHCQWRREAVDSSHPAAIATRATAGTVLTYGGEVFAAMYHGSCGGHTMAAEEVGLKGERYPYQPVDCEACRRSAPTWTRRLAASAWQSHNENQRLQINRRVGSRTLPSNHYTIRQDGEDVIVEGRGDGHGVGVCQKGIIDMARKGGDFRALLTRYLPQTRSAANVQ